MQTIEMIISMKYLAIKMVWTSYEDVTPKPRFFKTEKEAKVWADKLGYFYIIENDKIKSL
tara:strand:- start:288 stop:467 length:180 start_codon:yes stop_codon:yes gene_type:complete